MSDLAAERFRHYLLAIAKTKDREAQPEHGRVEFRSVFSVYACRPSAKDDCIRVLCRDFVCRRIARQNLGIDAQIAHAPRDELTVLRAEIEDDDFLHT